MNIQGQVALYGHPSILNRTHSKNIINLKKKPTGHRPIGFQHLNPAIYLSYITFHGL